MSRLRSGRLWDSAIKVDVVFALSAGTSILLSGMTCCAAEEVDCGSALNNGKPRFRWAQILSKARAEFVVSSGGLLAALEFTTVHSEAGLKVKAEESESFEVPKFVSALPL